MGSLFRIALRNVARNRRRSALTLSAVFLALSVMVGVRGFLNGVQATLKEGVIFGQTGALQIHRKGFLESMNGAPLDLDLPADDAFLQKIAAVPGVTAVAARIPFGAMVNANDETSFAMLTALDPAREYEVCPRRLELVTEGKPLQPSAPAAGLFSPQLLQPVGGAVGKSVAILTNDRDGVLNAVDSAVGGVMGEKGIPMPDKKIGVIPLALAQELLRMPGRATEIAIRITDLNQVDAMKKKLQDVVGPEYEVSTWHDVASFVDEIIKGQETALNFISATFLIVALLGIMNTMLMATLERTREIGTMMAVGVRRRQILGLFLLEAALLGLLGGILGAFAGGAFIAWAHAHGLAMTPAGSSTPMHIYPTIKPSFILFTFALASLGAALAALYPAFRASRLRPVEALASV